MTTLIKQFIINGQIGRSKYSISYHNGIDAHKDGSPFFGIYIFKNKKSLNSKIKDLLNDGYIKK